ncbi:hypothetical protein TYRP_009165 [Tyrophagus putrescentiae]|nr:hypothetical protein TYRP_009165 [Tyrophagus putrescentiae]
MLAVSRLEAAFSETLYSLDRSTTEGPKMFTEMPLKKPQSHEDKEYQAEGDEAGCQVEQHDGRRLKKLPDQHRNGHRDGARGEGEQRSDPIAQRQVAIAEGGEAGDHRRHAVAEQRRAGVDHRPVEAAEVEDAHSQKKETVVVGEDVLHLEAHRNDGGYQRPSGVGGRQDGHDHGRL